MSDLFETIKKFHPSIPGWCTPEKAEALASIVIALRPEVTVEIGVFGGSSAIPMALAHREIGRGALWAIDPWSPDASIENEVPENAKYWGSLNYEMIFADFKKLVNALGLGNCVKIIRARSDNAPLPEKIDVLHIDGNHQEQAVKDVARWCPFVRLGGLVIMDDIGWQRGNVAKAADNLKVMGCRELYKLGTGCVMQKL